MADGYEIGYGIDAIDYNNYVDLINPYWGSGFRDRGWGQTELARVALDTKVTASQWLNLVNVINSMSYHESGVNLVQASSFTNSIVPTQNEIIAFSSALNSSSSRVTNDSFRFISYEYDTDIRASAQHSLDWSYQLRSVGQVVFSTIEQARWFFNAGGDIVITIGHVASGSTAQDQSWVNLINNTPSITVKALNVINGRVGRHYWGSEGILYSSNSGGIYAANNITINITGNAGRILKFETVLKENTTSVINRPNTGTYTITITARPPKIHGNMINPGWNPSVSIPIFGGSAAVVVPTPAPTPPAPAPTPTPTPAPTPAPTPTPTPTPVSLPVFDPILATDTNTIGTQWSWSISNAPPARFNGGTPIYVQIRKKANVDNFFQAGYVANTWISAIGQVNQYTSLELSSEGAFNGAGNFNIPGVATFEVTFPTSSNWTYVNGNIRTLNVIVSAAPSVAVPTFNPQVFGSSNTLGSSWSWSISGAPTSAVNGGSPISVLIKKKANVDNFFGTGYIAETWVNAEGASGLSSSLSLDSQGSITGSGNFNIPGVATFEVTFPTSSNWAYTGGNIRTLTVNVYDNTSGYYLNSSPTTVTEGATIQWTLGRSETVYYGPNGRWFKAVLSGTNITSDDVVVGVGDSNWSEERALFGSVTGLYLPLSFNTAIRADALTEGDEDITLTIYSWLEGASESSAQAMTGASVRITDTSITPTPSPTPSSPSPSPTVPSPPTETS